MILYLEKNKIWYDIWYDISYYWNNRYDIDIS